MGWSKEYLEDNYDVDTRITCSICNKKTDKSKYIFFFGIICPNCLHELKESIRYLAKDYDWIKD